LILNNLLAAILEMENISLVDIPAINRKKMCASLWKGEIVGYSTGYNMMANDLVNYRGGSTDFSSISILSISSL